MTLRQQDLHKLAAILSQLLPNHEVEQWPDSQGLIGDIIEFDSMALTNLLAAIEEVFDVDIDESSLSFDDFASWGSLKAFVCQLLRN